MEEEQLDYGDEEHYGGGGAIPAIAEEEDDYGDLYDDVNVGQGLSQTMQQCAEPAIPFGDDGLPDRKANGPTSLGIPGVGAEGNGYESGSGVVVPAHKSSGLLPGKGLEVGSGDYRGGVSDRSNGTSDAVQERDVGNMGFRVSSSSALVHPSINVGSEFVGGASSLPSDPGHGTAKSQPSMPPNPPAIAAGDHPMMGDSSRADIGPVDVNGPTMLFVGELHWWTTDAELESVLSQYGRLKEIKFFDERASGKSKGYCQVEFYDAAATAACKEGMNGHVFNGRPCVVAYASPQTLKQMGAGAVHMNKNQAQNQSQSQGRRQMNDGVGRGSRMNQQGGDRGWNFGRGGWEGRGGQRFPTRGQGGIGPTRGRGGVGSKGMGGAAGGVGAGIAGGLGQGLAGPGLGSPAGGLMHPQGLMSAVFDPTYLGRGGPFGGYSGPAFPGMMPPFQAFGTIGFPGVAPNANPAFLGFGMPAPGMGMMGCGGMGMMGGGGMEGHSTGMWIDTGTGGCKVEDDEGKTSEFSYGGDDERGHLHEREKDWNRSDMERSREKKNGYRDCKLSDQYYDNEDNWDRMNSYSRSRSNSRTAREDDHRSGLREADHGKRRCLPSE